MTWTVLIQYWGAILATILGLIKVYEFIRDRRQLHVSFYSTYEENKIVVSSIGKNPIFVQSYFLYWRAHRWLGKKSDVNLADPEDDIINRSISIDSPLILTFNEQNNFPLSNSNMRSGKLYVGIRVAGNRNAIILKVYP